MFEMRFGHFRGRILNEFDMLIARKLRDGCFFASAASNIVLIENLGVKIEKNLNSKISKNNEKSLKIVKFL